MEEKDIGQKLSSSLKLSLPLKLISNTMLSISEIQKI